MFKEAKEEWLSIDSIDIAKNYICSQGWSLDPFILNILSSYLQPNARILDFGCGIGRIIEQIRLSTEDYHFVGYDLPNMIHLAKKYLSYECTLTDNWNQLTSTKFDMIYAILVLQHMPTDEIRWQLHDMSKMTKIMYIHSRSWTDYNSENVLNLLKIDWRVFVFQEDNDHFRAICHPRFNDEFT